jgi:uncharacterized protein (TIGR02391 family)
MPIEFKNKIPPFEAEHLESIAKIIADTDSGLTGTQIGNILTNVRIPDVDPQNTKWKRLYNAFVTFHNEHHVGNHVILFLNKTMNPVSYTSQPELFDLRRERLNQVLSFCGYEIGTDGKLRGVKRASTLSEAQRRAKRLKSNLESRNVHSEIFKYCEAEIISDNYFHAVVEAMKSITSRIRSLSGLDEDGSNLVGMAFGGNKEKAPILIINTYDSKTKIGEQAGFLNLLIGLYGTVRNPLNHEAKIEWNMEEQDAVDILTAISFVHRKLDKITKTKS